MLQGDREFFKGLELSNDIGQLDRIVEKMQGSNYVRMFSQAREQAKYIHSNLDNRARVDRLRSVVSCQTFSNMFSLDFQPHNIERNQQICEQRDQNLD